MGRCWSCGTGLRGGSRYLVTCPTCSMVEEQKKIRERLESSGAESLYHAIEAFTPDLSEVVGTLETGFSGVIESLDAGFEGLSNQLSEVAEMIEWQFERVEWKLDQMSGTLRSIDRTLKTPSQTQANEWRQIAEKLRERRVLDESKKFFLRSLDRNPLDYRAYIGLGKTYLQMGEFDKARTFWGKSLPHAPKREIDYRSYSYRLIGRAHFCEENKQDAALALQHSIQLSPNYYLGHYDFAQYSALIGEVEDCLNSLWVAILNEPIPTELVRRERNFRLLKEDVGYLLNQIEYNYHLQDEIQFKARLRKLGKGVFWKFDKAEKSLATCNSTHKYYPQLVDAEYKLNWVRNMLAINLDEGEIRTVEQAISDASNLILYARMMTEGKYNDARTISERISNRLFPFQ